MKTIILILLFIPLLAVSQTTAGMNGTLKDADGEPLIFATVLLYQGDMLVTGTYADDKGKYKLQNIEPGVYDLKVRLLGEEKAFEAIKLIAGENMVFNQEIAFDVIDGGCRIIVQPREWSYTVMPSGMILRAEDIQRGSYRKF